MSNLRLKRILFDLHEKIDDHAQVVGWYVSALFKSARRSMGQRFRKLNRDLQNDQNT